MSVPHSNNWQRRSTANRSYHNEIPVPSPLRLWFVLKTHFVLKRNFWITRALCGLSGTGELLQRIVSWAAKWAGLFIWHQGLSPNKCWVFCQIYWASYGYLPWHKVRPCRCTHISFSQHGYSAQVEHCASSCGCTASGIWAGSFGDNLCIPAWHCIPRRYCPEYANLCGFMPSTRASLFLLHLSILSHRIRMY